ncbi:hypothetical protein HYX14_00995 [Candidatus Woesearchaeota archaeon]|nr:hypothetical protein [Candidatus Woesearchaeota archaeon]
MPKNKPCLFTLGEQPPADPIELLKESLERSARDYNPNRADQQRDTTRAMLNEHPEKLYALGEPADQQ